MKDIHVAKYIRRGDVFMQCHRHGERKGEMRFNRVLKGTLSETRSITLLR